MPDAQPPPLLERAAAAFFGNARLLALMILLIVVAGGSSLAILPRMEDPVLRSRVALVITRLPGADASRVESLVTEKIESRLRDVPEILELNSESRGGVSVISVELREDVWETAPVWADVRGKVEDAIPDLPAEASRPFFDEMEVRAFSLITGVVWTGEGVREGTPADRRLLRRLAIELRDRLQNVSGTESVDLYGDPGEEIAVEIDPLQAASLGLTAAAVSQAVEAYDAKSAAGRLRGSGTDLGLEIANQLDAVSAVSSVPVADADGRDVRLRDIADVRAAVVDPPPRLATLEGRPAVVLAAMVRVDARIDNWTAAAERAIADFQAALPAGVALDRVLTQNDYVSERLANLRGNLLLGAAAVAGVIFVMMGWRSAAIVTMALPLSSLIVLFGYRVLGLQIHQMSVTGLIIAFGLLIDNAIVVVDEVKGRLRDGATPRDAMTGSVRHLAGPLLGSTLTTAFAFGPIAVMPGGGGEFVGAIGLSVIMAVFASLLLAMTVIPTVAAKLVGRRFRGDGPQEMSWLRRLARDGLSIPPLSRAYESLLRLCLSRPAVGVAVGLSLPVAGFLAAGSLREQFFPPTDRNQFHVQVDLPPATPIERTAALAAEMGDVIRQAGARRVDWFIGESAPVFYYNVPADRRGQPGFAQAIVTLPDGTDTTSLIRRLQQTVDERFLEARTVVRQLEQGPPFEAPVEARLFGPDPEVLRRLGEEIRSRIANHPDVVAVRTDLSDVLPRISLAVDEAAVQAAGLTPGRVRAGLSAQLDGARGGSVIQDNEQMPIVVRIADRDRRDLGRVSGLDTPLPGGGTAPLSALTSVSLKPEAAAVPRLNRRRMNEVSIYVRAGVLPSVVQSALDASLAAEPLDIPTGYEMAMAGEAGERDEAVGNLMSTAGILGVLMAATLVMSFGSFRLAAVIGLVGVLSTGLSMLALSVGGYPFGFMAIIGTMGLVGVAINDSIVVLAAVRANAKAAAGDADATVREVMHSTRHVIATTVTTMAGFTPLVLDGGDFWPPLAIAISGGVLGASLLALVLVPSLHQWVMRGLRTA